MDAYTEYELDELENLDLNLLEQEDDNDGENLAEIKERFKINDIGSANWTFRKIKSLQETVQENKILANEEKKRVDSWLQKENSQAEQSIEFFEHLIKDYLESERSKDKKFKLTTPYGKASVRKSKSWDFDNEKVINNLKNIGMNEFIKIEESIKKADLKKQLTVTEVGTVANSDGEVIEGITVSDKETVSITIS